MTTISVILPVRDRAGSIGRQLEALAGQDIPRTFEVIVADNGSTDDTAAVAASFADRFERLVVIDARAARGAAGTRNAAIEHASGSVLALCDSDDVADPSWLANLVAPLDDVAALVAGRIVPVAEGRRVPPASGRSAGRPRPRLLEFLPFADTCSLAIRTDDFHRIGGFDDSYDRCSDVEFSWRAQLGGLAFVDALDAVMVKYLPADSSGRWLRHYGWGRHHARLFRQYRSVGMPRRSPASVLTRYGKVAVRAALAWQPTQRDLLVWSSAEAVGHLAGSVQWRVWYP